MKWKQFILPLVITLTIVLACNKMQNKQQQSTSITSTSKASSGNSITASNTTFNASVGKLFPADTGLAWVNAYQKLYPGLSTKPCVFNVSDLQSLLKYPGSIGISFSNATLDGNPILIAEAVDASANIIKTDSVITTQGHISALKAESLKQEYAFSNWSNPNAVAKEFFGSNMLLNYFQNNMSKVVIHKGWNTKGERMIINSIDTTPSSGSVLEEGYPCGPNGCPPPSK